MSSATGSSFEALRWATSMMLLPTSIAASSALIDFGLPTNSGITMWGNTTTSRNGSSGSDWMAGTCSSDIRFSMWTSRPMLSRQRGIQALAAEDTTIRDASPRPATRDGANSQRSRPPAGPFATAGDARTSRITARRGGILGHAGPEGAARAPDGAGPKSVGAGNPRGFGVDHERLAVAFDRVLVDHHLLHVLQAGQVEHDVEQGLLEDRAQPPGAGLALERLAGDRLQRGRPHLEIDALHREQP